MRTLPKPSRVIASLLVVTWGVLGYACTVDDENPAPNRARPSTETDGGGEGGVNPTNTNPTGSLCVKYGGYDKVREMAAGIMSRVDNDCRLSGSFGRLSLEARQHVNECFEIQVGSFFQCPGITYTGSKANDGRPCKTMQQAHQGLKLRKADFTAFVETHVVAEFKARGMSDAEIVQVRSGFLGAESAVVTETNQPTRHSYCECANGEFEGKKCTPDLPEAGNDAGNDAGGGITDAASDG